MSWFSFRRRKEKQKYKVICGNCSHERIISHAPTADWGRGFNAMSGHKCDKEDYCSKCGFNGGGVTYA